MQSSQRKSDRAELITVAVAIALALVPALRLLANHPNESPGTRHEIKYLLLAQHIAGKATHPLTEVPQYSPAWPPARTLPALRNQRPLALRCSAVRAAPRSPRAVL